MFVIFISTCVRMSLEFLVTSIKHTWHPLMPWCFQTWNMTTWITAVLVAPGNHTTSVWPMASHLTWKMLLAKIVLTVQTDGLLQESSCWQVMHAMRLVTMYKTLRLIGLYWLGQSGSRANIATVILNDCGIQLWCGCYIPVCLDTSHDVNICVIKIELYTC